VAPGLFPTPGAWERLYPPGSQVEPQENSVPLRRFGEHIELANLFAYLAADESGYVTGDLIVIDGGRWMQGIGGPSTRAMQDWTDEQWAAMRKR
jgi:NAD(P)-dependent dehydrogenase (short-subunit alcohol dehydrogenase family)